MHMLSKCALSRGTRAQHMMVPQPRGWLGLLSTSTHIHTHASHTLVCATDSPRCAYERAACLVQRVENKHICVLVGAFLVPM